MIVIVIVVIFRNGDAALFQNLGTSGRNSAVDGSVHVLVDGVTVVSVDGNVSEIDICVCKVEHYALGCKVFNKKFDYLIRSVTVILLIGVRIIVINRFEVAFIDFAFFGFISLLSVGRLDFVRSDRDDHFVVVALLIERNEIATGKSRAAHNYCNN